MRTFVKFITVLLAMILSAMVGFSLGTRQRPAAPVHSPSIISDDGDKLDSFREERRQLRQTQIEQLNEMIHGSGADAEVRSMAQRRLLDLLDWIEKETTLEGLLTLRGFNDVIVAVHSDSVNVMLRENSLNSQQTAIILELAIKETGISAGNVKIVPIN